MKIETIGDFFEVKGGKRLPKGSSFSEGKTSFPYIRVTDFNRNGIDLENIKYIDSEIQEKIKRYVIYSNEIYISIAGTIGIVGIIPKELDGANLTENAAKLIPKEGVLVYPQYLSYYLNSYNIQNIIRSKTMAVGVPKLALFRIKEIPITLPPLPEQKKIAAILDEADRLRQLNQQVLDQYNALTQSLFLDMFGDPVTNPMDWEKVKLNKVCNKITDGTHHSPEPQEKGFPYISAKHVKNYGLDFYAKPAYVSKEAHEEIYKRCNPEFGDILYIKDGATTGVACLNTFNEPFSMLSSLALLKVDSEKINNRYLCYWLNHSGIKEKLISEFMSGAAIKRYTLKKINSFTISLPSLDLQTQFATRIQIIETQKTQAQAALTESENLFNSLLQKAFKGELTS